MSRNQPELVRGLGLWSASAIVVGSMIGTGIFLVPSEMARQAGSVPLVFAAWIAGAALTLFGALALAEMGSALPEAGGPYAYLKRGFGPVWGFLYGWTIAILERPASVAAIAAGVLRFGGYLTPAVVAPLFTWELALPFLSEPYAFRFTAAQPLAAAVILVVTGVNYLGIRLGGRVQVALTAAKVFALLAVTVLGFAVDAGQISPAGAAATPLHPAAVGGFLAALVAALWAYDGWTAATLVGGEIEHPHKNLSRALVGSVLFVAAVYVLANMAYFSALSLPGVAQSQQVASDVVQRFAGAGAAKWITLAMLLSALGALNSTVLSGARVPYAMARDGRFFRFAASIHPTFHTPGRALFFQGFLGILFALTGTFEELFSLVIFAAWIFYGLTVAALFRLRQREPTLPRPYRAWGYPWAPAVFMAGAFALTVNLWWEYPLRSSIGLALILSGLAFYRYWSQKQPAS